jgi:hypothetical protein
MNTIAYEPVIVNGNHFMTSFINAPHNFASNVSDAIDQVKNFSIFIVIIAVLHNSLFLTHLANLLW